MRRPYDTDTAYAPAWVASCLHCPLHRTLTPWNPPIPRRRTTRARIAAVPTPMPALRGHGLDDAPEARVRRRAFPARSGCAHRRHGLRLGLGHLSVGAAQPADPRHRRRHQSRGGAHRGREVQAGEPVLRRRRRRRSAVRRRPARRRAELVDPAPRLHVQRLQPRRGAARDGEPYALPARRRRVRAARLRAPAAGDRAARARRCAERRRRGRGSVRCRPADAVRAHRAAARQALRAGFFVEEIERRTRARGCSACRRNGRRNSCCARIIAATGTSSCSRNTPTSPPRSSRAELGRAGGRLLSAEPYWNPWIVKPIASRASSASSTRRGGRSAGRRRISSPSRSAWRRVRACGWSSAGRPIARRRFWRWTRWKGDRASDSRIRPGAAPSRSATCCRGGGRTGGCAWSRAMAIRGRSPAPCRAGRR